MSEKNNNNENSQKSKKQNDLIYFEKELKNEIARHAEDKYHTLFNSIDEGFCIVELVLDKKGKIDDIYFREVNTAFEKQSGFTNVIGKTVKELLPHFEKHWMDIFAEVLKTGESSRIENYVQDVGRWYTAYFSLVGEIGSKYIAVVFNDITERKKVEETLQKAAKQKDEFIGIASHELKTPVTSIKTFTEVLENRFYKKGDKVSAQLLGKMKGQINKLAILINDLLDVTRIGNGKLQITKASFDFDMLVTEKIEEVQRTAQGHQIIKEGETKKIIFGDKEKIGEAIINFLTNAIKYSPKEKKIILRIWANNKEVLLSVQDFGVGVAQIEQQKIFERFYRESGAKELTFPGLGIGLYVAAEIIKKHGGKIWVESTKGKGATFYFLLPIKKNKKNDA